MDQQRLQQELEAAFDGDEEQLRVVARQARDLADSGLYEDDIGEELTVETVVENLEDAPEDGSVIERWNWWLGSLDLSHGGYERFRVRSDLVE